jgi:hypothetical protein
MIIFWTQKIKTPYINPSNIKSALRQMLVKPSQKTGQKLAKTMIGNFDSSKGNCGIRFAKGSKN